MKYLKLIQNDNNKIISALREIGFLGSDKDVIEDLNIVLNKFNHNVADFNSLIKNKIITEQALNIVTKVQMSSSGVHIFFETNNYNKDDIIKVELDKTYYYFQIKTVEEKSDIGMAIGDYKQFNEVTLSSLIDKEISLHINKESRGAIK